MDISFTWSLWDYFTLVVGIYIASIMFWHWTLTNLVQLHPVRKGEWARRWMIIISFIPLAPICATVAFVVYMVVIFARAAHIPQGFMRLRKWWAIIEADIDHEVAIGGLSSFQHNPNGTTDFP